MLMFVLIVICSKCGGLLLGRVEQKTRSCPYCGFRVDLKKAQRVTSAKNAYEASAILKKLKKRKKFNR